MNADKPPLTRFRVLDVDVDENVREEGIQEQDGGEEKEDANCLNVNNKDIVRYLPYFDDFLLLQ